MENASGQATGARNFEAASTFLKKKKCESKRNTSMRHITTFRSRTDRI